MVHVASESSDRTETATLSQISSTLGTVSFRPFHRSFHIDVEDWTTTPGPSTRSRRSKFVQRMFVRCSSPTPTNRRSATRPHRAGARSLPPKARQHSTACGQASLYPCDQAKRASRDGRDRAYQEGMRSLETRRGLRLDSAARVRGVSHSATDSSNGSTDCSRSRVGAVSLSSNRTAHDSVLTSARRPRGGAESHRRPCVKRTFQPNNRRRKRRHGFRHRMSDRAGRSIIKNRRRRQRRQLTA